MNEFLTCAMMLPVLAFAPIKVEHSHVTFSRFLKMQQRILLVGGNPTFVDMFRADGLKAFGALTEDQPGATPWHIVSEPQDIGFRAETFQAVYWLHPNVFGSSGLVWMHEAIRLIQPGGYLLFDDEHFSDWHYWLNIMLWDRMPFRMGSLVIYQRRKMNKSLKGSNHKHLLRFVSMSS